MDQSVYILPAIPNNYTDLLVNSLPDETNVHRNERMRPFTLFLPDVARCQPDTIHLHWPHPYFLFFDLVPTRPLAAAASALAAAFFILQLRLAGLFVGSVVWTVHNKQNHDQLQPRVERWTHCRIARMADTITAWDERTKAIVAREFDIDEDRVVIVPHNNYRPVYDEYGVEGPPRVCGESETYDRVLLYFGRIRPYKNVDGLVRAFRDLDREDTLLVVAGDPADSLAADLHALIDKTDHVVGDLRFIPDSEVPAYFAYADLAVFPYSQIFNSGSVVLAMSFGTPFIAPDEGAIPGIAPEGNVVYTDLTEGLRRGVEMDAAALGRVGRQNLDRAKRVHSRERVREALLTAYGWT